MPSTCCGASLRSAVVAMNVVNEFRVSIFERFLSPNASLSPVGSIVETIGMRFLDLKGTES